MNATAADTPTVNTCNPPIPRHCSLLPFICPFSMGQGSLALYVLSHVVLGPLSDVTHLIASQNIDSIPSSTLSQGNRHMIDKRTQRAAGNAVYIEY